MPPANFVIEPEPRGTAPAIALAAAYIHRRDPQAVMACLTADHFIAETQRFRDLLQAAAEVAGQDYLVTLGIEPVFPSTGFGYIQRGEPLGEFGGFPAFQVRLFKEKPSLPEAEAMLADGQHAWNSGMFIWRTARILGEFARLMPDFHQGLLAALADPEALGRVWSAAPKTTIDYGIMEQASQVAVLPAAGLGWNDVGSWESLREVLPLDVAGNLVVGAQLLNRDTRNTLVHVTRPEGARRLVATIGLEDVVIVDTEDVLLVCRRDRAQEVRALVEQLKGSAGGQSWL